MLSPFFNLEAREVPFHDLHSDAILPFTEEGQKDRPRQGHHGSVWRVKIHPAHHDLHEDDGGKNPYFAVKELNSADEGEINFKNEVNAWAKSVGATDNPHLIRLLATWRKKQRWHLLFPWAKGNLRDYWKTSDISRPDPSLVQWIAKQCLGIAQGLMKIHRNGSEDRKDNHHDWGIHGDIKPENILLFDDRNNAHGILVICDFGFTRFHGRDTRSNANPVGYTATYRAPEYDTKHRISRAYDMWNLGCLYLEFITWYLTGSYSAVEIFCSMRTKEDHGEPIRMDKFFVCVSISDEHTLGAIIKPCVLKWIRRLRSMKRCSDFFHDLLDMIERDLLVIDPQGRKKCDRVVRNLREIYNKCIKEGESYSFTGSPKPLSEELSPVGNFPVPFSYPETEVERMASSEFPLPIVSTQGEWNTWMVNSGSSGERQWYQDSNIDSIFASEATQIATHFTPLIAERARLEMDLEEEEDEETPLLTTSRVSRETVRQTQESRLWTQSPEPLERKASKSKSLLGSTQSSDETHFGGMETRTEEGGGDETASGENMQSRSYGERIMDSTSPSFTNGSPKLAPEYRARWHEANNFWSAFSTWVGHWFDCGANRTKSYNQTRC